MSSNTERYVEYVILKLFLGEGFYTPAFGIIVILLKINAKSPLSVHELLTVYVCTLTTYGVCICTLITYGVCICTLITYGVCICTLITYSVSILWMNFSTYFSSHYPFLKNYTVLKAQFVHAQG